MLQLTTVRMLNAIVSKYKQLGWFERWVYKSPDSDITKRFLQFVDTINRRISNDQQQVSSQGEHAKEDAISAKNIRDAHNNSDNSYLTEEEQLSLVLFTLTIDEQFNPFSNYSASRETEMFRSIRNLTDCNQLLIFLNLQRAGLLNLESLRIMSQSKPQLPAPSNLPQPLPSKQGLLAAEVIITSEFSTRRAMTLANLRWAISFGEYYVYKGHPPYRVSTFAGKMLATRPLTMEWALTISSHVDPILMTNVYILLDGYQQRFDKAMQDALSEHQNPESLAKGMVKLLKKAINPMVLVPSPEPNQAADALIMLHQSIMPCVDYDNLGIGSKVIALKNPLEFIKDVIFIHDVYPQIFCKDNIEKLWIAYQSDSPTALVKHPTIDQSVMSQSTFNYVVKTNLSHQSRTLVNLLGDTHLNDERIAKLPLQTSQIANLVEILYFLDIKSLQPNALDALISTPLNNNTVTIIKNMCNEGVLGPNHINLAELLSIMRPNPSQKFFPSEKTLSTQTPHLTAPSMQQ